MLLVLLNNYESFGALKLFMKNLGKKISRLPHPLVFMTTPCRGVTTLDGARRHRSQFDGPVFEPEVFRK